MHADSRAVQTRGHLLGRVMFPATAGITTAFRTPSQQTSESNLEAA